MSEKEAYILWAQQVDLPLFFQPWWLNAVCCQGKTWDVILYRQGNEIQAALVFQKMKKYGFTCFLLPQLTPYLGCFFISNITPEEKKHIFSYLLKKLDQLKPSIIQLTCFSKEMANQISQIQKFNINKRVTYIINDLNNIDNLFSQFHHSKQRHIHKAEKSLQVDFSLSVEQFCQLHAYQYQIQGKKDFYAPQLLQTILHEAILHNQGQILAIKDNTEIHAAIFVAWDKHTAYNLLYFIHPRYRSSGASSLMIFEILKYLQNKHITFDFEGSMQKNIADSYAKFATRPFDYYLLEKINSPLLKILSWFSKNHII